MAADLDDPVPAPAPDPVLTAERAHLDTARDCLDAMRASADRIADYGVDELASFALGRLRAQRLAALEADPDAPPFFGRTDNSEESFHIGRRHVRDPLGDPVVIDWRAPMARAFYRATSSDPQGIRLRRRFGFAEARAGTTPLITSYEDERLDLGEALGLDSQLLREEIERPRVGPMRDIVATIQPDQDELVRADLDTSLCVQGAPGTGKTAVGLHRAAYLLFTYPDRLRHSGVLVVGPNQAFLHYIAQVLPALGEAGIEQATVPELCDHVPVRAEDPPGVADLKGDLRMATVLRRALLRHVARPTDDVVALVGTKRYRIPERRLRRYVDDARRAMTEGTGELHWNTARDRLRLQVAEDVRRQREDAGGAPTDGETRTLARSAPVKQFVDEVWPPLTAPGLLARLYDETDLLARAAGDLLTAQEQQALHRPAPKSLRSVRWTAADAVLIDELAGLIDGVPSYVHAVVDEAQDLSAMQCRVVGRRCPLGSVTVLGDLAQATTTWAPGSWADTLTYLGHPGTAVHPLTAGYRVPGTVLALANRLLPHIARDVPPATSVRAGEDALHLAARTELTGQVRQCLDVAGSVGVIVADAEVDATAELLRAAGLDVARLDEPGDDSTHGPASSPEVAEPIAAARVTVVPAGQAKGLEYDSVLVVEPADVVAAEPTRTAGLRRLYVVLTRAVSRLVVLHDQPLPPELA